MVGHGQAVVSEVQVRLVSSLQGSRSRRISGLLSRQPGKLQFGSCSRCSRQEAAMIHSLAF